MPTPTGFLSILNAGLGDIKLTFDTTNPSETIRAKRMITDMLKRGYALLVKDTDGHYTRATHFDEQTGEYVLADFDEQPSPPDQTPSLTPPPSSKRRGNRARMEQVETVAIARSAGG